ncbi:hypothetical protein D3C84_887950 [compost metagenome]
MIDVGSGTVNFGTLIDRRFRDKGSFTLTDGMETLETANPEAFGRQIALRAIRGGWKRTDRVYVCGGGGAKVLEHIQKPHFPLAVMIEGDPVLANVRAFFMIARKLYAQG